jgi:hypothetical protein
VVATRCVVLCCALLCLLTLVLYKELHHLPVFFLSPQMDSRARLCSNLVATTGEKEAVASAHMKLRSRKVGNITPPWGHSHYL